MAPFLILRTTASLAGIVAWSVQRGRDLLSEGLTVTELGQIPSSKCRHVLSGSDCWERDLNLNEE